MATFPGDMNIGWGFGIEGEHCTGSPTCQCSDCRLTEYNSGEAPEDQLPHQQKTEEVYNGFQYVSVLVEEEEEDESQDNVKDAIMGNVAEYVEDESQLTDPLLAVSELEQHVLALQGQLLVEQAHSQEQLMRIQQLEARNTDDYALALGGRVNLLEAEVARGEQRITDLEERLRSLTFVVNELVMRLDIVASWQMVHDAGVAEKE